MIMYMITKNEQQIGFLFGKKEGALLMFNSIFEHKQKFFNVKRINKYKFIIINSNSQESDIFEVKTTIID